MRVKLEIAFGPDETRDLPKDPFGLIGYVENRVDLPGHWGWKIKRQNNGVIRLTGRLQEQ